MIFFEPQAWPQVPDENSCFTYPYDCSMSQCFYGYYLRDYAYVPHSDEMNCFNAGCHTVGPMHAAHFFSQSGPGFTLNESGCDECHASGQLQCDVGPVFADLQLFDHTTECSDCHHAAPESP